MDILLLRHITGWSLTNGANVGAVWSLALKFLAHIGVVHIRALSRLPRVVGRDALRHSLLLLKFKLLLLKHLLGSNHDLQRTNLKTSLLRKSSCLIHHSSRGHVKHLVESMCSQVSESV